MCLRRHYQSQKSKWQSDDEVMLIKDKTSEMNLADKNEVCFKTQPKIILQIIDIKLRKAIIFGARGLMIIINIFETLCLRVL
jgi:hypothetical protein